jgi:hypothetical protein
MAKRIYQPYDYTKVEIGKKKQLPQKKYEPVKPLLKEKEDVVNMALIAMRRKNLSTVQESDRLKRITENLNKKIRRSDSKHVSDIVHYWMSKLHG